MFDKKKEPSKDKNYSDAHLDYSVRSLEATVALVQYLYSLLISYKDKGINCVTIAYLLDSACAYLLTFYGGRSDLVEEIRNMCEKELQQHLNRPDIKEETSADLKKISEEMKKMGVNFTISKDIEPKLDKKNWKPTQADIEAWMLKNMDFIIDEYLKRKKKEDNGSQS